jgi:hypothetical protein
VVNLPPNHLPCRDVLENAICLNHGWMCYGMPGPDNLGTGVAGMCVVTREEGKNGSPF